MATDCISGRLLKHSEFIDGVIGFTIDNVNVKNNNNIIIIIILAYYVESNTQNDRLLSLGLLSLLTDDKQTSTSCVASQLVAHIALVCVVVIFVDILFQQPKAT